jgi:AraC-like DNA-binding protein
VGGEQTVTAEGLQELLTQAAVSGPVLEMRPGTGVRPEPLKRLDEFESELLDRGVEVHILCQHVTRFDPDLREELRLREEQGGLVRTMDTLPGWFLVIGDALALVPPPQGDDGTDTGAAGLVRDPTVVGVLRAVFTDYWLRARPFSQGRWRGAQIEGVSQEVNAVIIRMLCTGAKDELVAKRLGMSVRTLRRRIADMLGGLGAASRFQAGFEIGRSLGDQAICDAERRLEDNFGIAG